jgi:hypothetical protein
MMAFSLISLRFTQAHTKADIAQFRGGKLSLTPSMSHDATE